MTENSGLDEQGQHYFNNTMKYGTMHMGQAKQIMANSFNLT